MAVRTPTPWPSPAVLLLALPLLLGAAPGEALRIEVLGDGPLRKIAKGGAFDRASRYRVEGVKKLLTLAEVKEHVRRLQKGKPPLKRVEAIVYRDSPAPALPPVKDLTDWLEGLGAGIKSATQEIKKDAPVD